MDNLPANSSANAERDKQRNFLYLVYGLYIVTVFTAGIAALTTRNARRVLPVLQAAG